MQHKHVRNAAGALHRAGGLELAIGARKHGDHKNRLCPAYRARFDPPGCVEYGNLDRNPFRLRLSREHVFQRLFVSRFQLRQIDLFSAPDDQALFACFAQRLTHGFTLRQLHDKRAEAGRKQFFLRSLRVKSKSKPVAEAHLKHRLRNAASARRIDRERSFIRDERMNLLQQRVERSRIRQTFFSHFGRKQRNARARALKFRRTERVCVSHREREADQRRRHIQRVKRAAHAVLAADGGYAEVELRLHRA